MTAQKVYFVSVDAKEIRTISIPSEVEYEIIATPDELIEVRKQFKLMEKDSNSALINLVHPFDEAKVDVERENYDRHLLRLYQLINTLGTEQTRSKMKEIGILNKV